MMEIVRKPKPPLRYACPSCGAALDARDANAAPHQQETVCPACGTRCALCGGDAVRSDARARPAVKVVPTGMGATIRLG